LLAAIYLTPYARVASAAPAAKKDAEDLAAEAEDIAKDVRKS
jgi:hypothetical protein